MLRDLLQPILGHHPAGLAIGFARPVEMIPLEFDSETAPRRIEHPNAFRHDFPADTVARNDGNPMPGLHPCCRIHCCVSSSVLRNRLIISSICSALMMSGGQKAMLSPIARMMSP